MYSYFVNLISVSQSIKDSLPVYQSEQDEVRELLDILLQYRSWIENCSKNGSHKNPIITSRLLGLVKDINLFSKPVIKQLGKQIHSDWRLGVVLLLEREVSYLVNNREISDQGYLIINNYLTEFVNRHQKMLNLKKLMVAV